MDILPSQFRAVLTTMNWRVGYLPGGTYLANALHCNPFTSDNVCASIILLCKEWVYNKVEPGPFIGKMELRVRGDGGATFRTP